MQYLRRLIKFFILLFILSILSIRIFATEYTIPEKQENKYVYDVENQITADNAEKINQWCKELDEKTNIQIYVFTFKGIKRPHAMKTYILADQINQKMQEEGKETITIFVSNEQEKIIVDYSAGLEVCTLYYVKLYHSYLEENTYNYAIRSTVSRMITQMAEEQEVDIQGVFKQQDVEKNEYKDDTFGRVAILITIVFLTVIVIIAIFNVAKEEFIANRKW